MSALSEQDIFEAFNKTVEHMTLPTGVKLSLVTEDMYPKVLDVAKECFVGDEPVGKSIGLQWTDEFESFWLTTLKANLSIVLINEDNGDIMGFRATKLIKRNDKFDISTIKDDKWKVIVELLTCGDTKFFDKYGIEEAFHFLGLGVAKKYRRQGLATVLMQTAVTFLGNLGISPYYIKGEGTSNFSKKTYEKCGFDTILNYPYDEYKKDGIVVFNNTGEHKSMSAYGIKKECV